MKSTIEWKIVDLESPNKNIPENEKDIVFLLNTVDFGGPLGKENEGIATGRIFKDNENRYILMGCKFVPLFAENPIHEIATGFTWCYIKDIITQ